MSTSLSPTYYKLNVDYKMYINELNVRRWQKAIGRQGLVVDTEEVAVPVVIVKVVEVVPVVVQVVLLFLCTNLLVQL